MRTCRSPVTTTPTCGCNESDIIIKKYGFGKDSCISDIIIIITTTTITTSIIIITSTSISARRMDRSSHGALQAMDDVRVE